MKNHTAQTKCDRILFLGDRVVAIVDWLSLCVSIVFHFQVSNSITQEETRLGRLHVCDRTKTLIVVTGTKENPTMSARPHPNSKPDRYLNS